LFVSYIGYLLFGPQSLSALLSLEERRDQIRADVEDLKEQNAKIQKEYFELKMLHGKEP
jgi:chaperonin cofactor prefoldin